MTSNRRVSFGLIADILDALEQHGHLRGDDQHAGRAIGLIGDLARIWEGTQDHPAGTHLSKIPSAAPGSGTVTLAGQDISTVLAALDEAAEYKRDRAETCADCPDQSCLTCQARLQGAQEYDHLAAQVLQEAEAPRSAHSDQPEPGSPRLSPGQPGHAADREAGQ
jgi:hypothetical protein